MNNAAPSSKFSRDTGPLRFLRELARQSVPAIVPQEFWEQ